MLRIIYILAIVLLLSGCAASYVTPGGFVNLSDVKDTDIKEIYETKSTVKFPANIAYTRIQQSGYSSFTQSAYGSGSFSIITAREMETDDQFNQIREMPQVNAIAAISKIIVPKHISGLKDLRVAAAKLHAGILLVYTFDTTFKVGLKDFGAMDVISLGFMESKEVKVTSTASAAFYDAKTGYLYGLAEATEKNIKKSTFWGDGRVVDELRIKTESSAFESLISEIKTTWGKILKEYNKGS